MIKIDPRARVVMVFLISSASVIIKEVVSMSLLFCFTVLICMFLRIPLLSSMKKLRKLWYFFFVLALVQSVFTPGGEVLFGVAGLRILTTAGLESGVSIILRMAIIVFSALIIASAPAMDIIYGLIAMKLPYEIAYMVLLAIKFLPLFREEFSDSITAIQLAGADLEKIPIKRKLSLYTYIFTPTVIKALKRARYISVSMECRGFRAYSDRTSYCKLHMKKADYLSILVTAAVAAAIVLFSFGIIVRGIIN